MLKENKETHIKRRRTKDIPECGDKVSTGWEGSLCLHKEMFQTPGPFLDAHGSKDGMHETAFPNVEEKQ